MADFKDGLISQYTCPVQAIYTREPCFLQMASTRRPAAAQGLSVRLDGWHDASCVLIPPGGDVSADASDKSTACLMFLFPKMCVSYLICDGAIGDDMWRRKWGVQRQKWRELFPLPRLSRCQFTYAVLPFRVHVGSWLHKALFDCVAPWRLFFAGPSRCGPEW